MYPAQKVAERGATARFKLARQKVQSGNKKLFQFFF
jgi:hypothetical protein